VPSRAVVDCVFCISDPHICAAILCPRVLLRLSVVSHGSLFRLPRAHHAPFDIETLESAICIPCRMPTPLEFSRLASAVIDRCRCLATLRISRSISQFVEIADCVSWLRLAELPYKHAGAAARLSDSPGLGGNIVYGRHVLVNHAASIRFAADELFNLYRTMAVHDLSRAVHLFV